jgi:Sortase domain
MRLWRPAAAVIASAGLTLSVYGISKPPHVQPPMSVAQGRASTESAVPTVPPSVFWHIPRPTSSSAIATRPRPPRRQHRHVLVHKASTLQEPRSAPAQLALPSLGLSSWLGPARGLNADGTVDDAPLAGPTWSLPWWYDEGPSPGQSGSAVILGHVDSALGQGNLGVFFRLGDLRAGQRVEVTLANHTTTQWVVTSVHLYSDAVFPDALVYARTGPPALRLVTCGGSFNWSTHEYESSLVVTARLVTTS